MALVDYGSDSDSGSPQPQSRAQGATAASKRALPPVDDHAAAGDDSDGDDDDAFNPHDTFGLARIQAEGTTAPSQPGAAPALRDSAPEVIAAHLASSNQLVTRPTDNVIFYNASYQDLTRPVQGPANPWNDNKLERQNALTGHVEQQHFSEHSFREQQRTFHVLGYAANPSIAAGTSAAAPTFVGNAGAAMGNQGATAALVKPSRREVREMKRKRMAKGTLGEFDDPDEAQEEAGAGAAAGEGAADGAGAQQDNVDGDDDEGAERQAKRAKKPQREYVGPWAGWEGESLAVAIPTEEEYEEQEAQGGPLLSKEERRKKVLEDANRREVGFGQEKSVFHGKETHDYLGRTYLHVPTDVEGVNLRGTPGEQECFVPKRCVHTWSGHTKGVSRIQVFPGSGHLILSGSLDTRVKLWDVYGSGKCLRTFMGHSKAVHDVTFDNSGAQFLSAAFDRQMKLWDTETGQCKQAFSNGKIPYCIKFHPEQQSTFLAGMSDKKVVQYDMRSGEITQEYNQHLGPVNTITFVDENRRFVTTSDDKTMRVWDFDIPVPIKLIADPAMHSMPAVGIDPKGKWLAATSLDNQIVLFGADTFKQNRKKRFAGHTIAGYACEPRFSPDGRFLSSGDGQGNVVFWDFKNGRIVGRLQRAHKQVVLSHAWLPHETRREHALTVAGAGTQSKVVTSSWDGLIKLWD
ncbi:Pre-mRNA splicing factor [Rhodotorula diobovata]|uniref:Pre-mRNA-processing factor 17 n=1 Tax=Rhodotorula diobovata TaxID=5288 RepID=A0A5C5FM87_9BASI|nr:Pre-mRNA splicing factor [Rhodotorula diobovata]